MSLSNLMSRVRCGTWLYRFLIFASFFTFNIQLRVIYYSNYMINNTINISIVFNALSLPFWHSIPFEVFFSNSTKCSVANENATGFSCKPPTRCSHECPWVKKCKMLHFSNSALKIKFISPLFLKIRKIKRVWGTHLQPYKGKSHFFQMHLL